MTKATHTPGPSAALARLEAGYASAEKRDAERRRREVVNREAPAMLEALRFLLPLAQDHLRAGNRLTMQGQEKMAKARAILARIDGTEREIPKLTLDNMGREPPEPEELDGED